MTTGTEGNDVLRNDQGVVYDLVQALGGDDQIIVEHRYPDYTGTQVSVDGGSGDDTLMLAGTNIRAFAGGVDNFDIYGPSLSFRYYGRVDFTNVEHVILSMGYMGSDPFIFAASDDSIHFSRAANGMLLNLQTNGGDDRITLTGLQVGGTIDAGTGADLVDLSGAALTRNPQFTVHGGDGNDVIMGSAGTDQAGGASTDILFGDAGDDFVNGGAGAGQLHGGDGNDSVIGGAATDLLYGDSGNDILNSGGGADEMRGGTGDDVYFVLSSDRVFEAAGEGFDTVTARSSYALAAGQSIERLVASDPSATDTRTFTGNEFANEIIGNAGNNRIDGRGGVDLLKGGLGNDVYFVDPGDSVIELAGQGLDYVYARGTYALAAGVEAEVFATADYTITTRVDLTGNDYNNSITGSQGVNMLRGGGGDDTLKGLGGNDVLDGNAGLDYLFGGAGNDIYYVDTGDNVNETAGEGTDAVYARSSFTLMANSHAETLATADYRLTTALDLTGNNLANTISGNNGVNTLKGGGGNDSLSGLDGNDVLEGAGGKDNMTGGTGADSFRFLATSDSAVGNADELLDFVSGTDRIDLSLIDANSNVPGDQQFAYIGTGAFTSAAGQLRSQAFGSTTHIFGDINGDGVADFEIIANSPLVTAGDFIF